MSNTSAFIEAIIAKLNTVKANVVFYYDRAPKEARFPYGVVSGVNASELSAGDLTTFDIDLWTDDKLPSATEDIEELCDDIRNALHNSVISDPGVFGGHIGYENRDTTDDRDTDISHRRLYFAARIFYQ